MCYVQNNNKQSGIREYNNAWYSFSRSKEGEKQWGKYNIPIYTDKDCTNTTESSTKRQGFYIHGGESYGDNGGIDLSKEDGRFFRVLESLKQEYKNALEYIKDDKGRIIIKLEVGYGTGEMVLEVVRKWEYRGNGNPNNWATISEFSLKLDGEIVKDSDNKEIKGYIVEPAGTNPNPNRAGHNLPLEQQQKTSGSDTRIPAGEYEVFWRPSSKKVTKNGIFWENCL